MANDYGSLDRNAASQSTPRAGYRASGPGTINLPPSPYTDTRADPDPDAAARSNAPTMSPSIPGSRAASNPRRMSFKRRAPSVGQRHNFLQRASMGVFPRKLSTAGSDATNPRILRRVHTTGVPSGGIHDNDNDDGTIDIDALIAAAETPSIPRMLPSAKADPFSTPIPALPFIVLCLVCFGEFSSAGVAGPFLFFMIEDFGVGGESDVGFWAGIVSASFFFAQFLTSLMWASVADKRGRRFVLAISLLGNALTMVLFGTSQNLGSPSSSVSLRASSTAPSASQRAPSATSPTTQTKVAPTHSWASAGAWEVSSAPSSAASSSIPSKSFPASLPTASS